MGSYCFGFNLGARLLTPQRLKRLMSRAYYHTRSSMPLKTQGPLRPLCHGDGRHVISTSTGIDGCLPLDVTDVSEVDGSQKNKSLLFCLASSRSLCLDLGHGMRCAICGSIVLSGKNGYRILFSHEGRTWGDMASASIALPARILICLRSMVSAVLPQDSFQ